MRVGVDVGGTNTDAVLMDGRRVVRKAKTVTTDDVTSGIVRAMELVLGDEPVDAVMVGTTHFVNALIECRGAARTAVFRLCGPATSLLPPFCDWPGTLRDGVAGDGVMLPGGHEFDGTEISAFDEAAVAHAVRDARARGVEAVAVCGVFSPVNPEHETRAADVIRDAWPELPVTLSHEIGRIGILERENAAALNAALAPIARRTVEALRGALERLGIDAPLFLSQNDGTLMDADYALRYPVLAIASGPTNSMRGAALLSGARDALVVDVGGTSTDVGALVRGFPREAPLVVEIAGVRTNFRMPDLLSIALGGGSVVREEPFAVGPDSVGARLGDEALVFGGGTLTATDLAVAAGRARIGEADRVGHLDGELVRRGVDEIRRRIEESIDRVKLSPDPVPVVLVGGGSVLVEDRLAGVAEIARPEHAEVANAIGAAIAQVGGQVDRVVSLEREGREQALASAREEATGRAVEAGASAGSVEIVELEEVPLTYLPGNAVRIRVRAVGDLAEL